MTVVEEALVPYNTIVLKMRVCGARKRYQAVSRWWPQHPYHLSPGPLVMKQARCQSSTTWSQPLVSGIRSLTPYLATCCGHASQHLGADRT